MTTEPLRNARWLLDKLEDPFTMFPVESIADTLFKAIDKAETRKTELMGFWGMSRKFWTVEQEHYHEEVGLLVGAMFVLGQAAITQTVSILSELRRHPQAESVIPIDKTNKLIAHAAIESETKLSKILIINEVSNYFKHVYEWPEQWDAASVNNSQAKTIKIILQIGMKPNEITDNLLIAADCLEFGYSNSRAIPTSIQEWREGWARALYPQFGWPDPAAP